MIFLKAIAIDSILLPVAAPRESGKKLLKAKKMEMRITFHTEIACWRPRAVSSGSIMKSRFSRVISKAAKHADIESMIQPVIFVELVTSCFVISREATAIQIAAMHVPNNAMTYFELKVFLILIRLHLQKTAQIGKAIALDVIDISSILVNPKMKKRFSVKLQAAG